MDDKGHIKMKIKDILNRLDVIAEADAQPAQPPLVIPQSLTNKIANDPNNRTVAQQNPPIGSQSAQPVPKQNAGTAAGYKGSAGAQAIAKASGVADVNKIKAGQQLTLPDGTKYTVKPGDTLDKIAAANKGAAAPAAAPTNAPAAAPTNAPAPSADNEKLKQNIAAGAPAAEAPAATADSNAAPAAGAEDNGASPGAAQAMANMGSQPTGSTTPAAPADDLARMTQLAGAGKPAGGYGNFTGDQSAQPAPEEPAVAAPAAAPNPDTVAPVVKTGTGGTLTTRDGKPVTSRSNDEIAWASKQPMGGTGQQYPGAGNWDPRTGRDLKAAAQGEKNWNAIKGFFGGNKQPAAAPAAPAAGQGQSTQPEPAAPAGGYGKFNESELSIIKHLSGLK
jgi:LysM repeat protein